MSAVLAKFRNFRSGTSSQYVHCCHSKGIAMADEILWKQCIGWGIPIAIGIAVQMNIAMKYIELLMPKQ